MPSDDDRSLVDAAKRDPARFAELYDRNLDRVYAFVRRRTTDRATAEDVTSEVFQQALAGLPEFEWRGTPFVAWLYRIAANTLADRWRKDGRLVGSDFHDVPDGRECADIERRVMVVQAVDRLPETQRRVIQLRFGEERSLREVAAALARSEGAIKQLQLRALENLRKEMGRHD